jgi:hypothetical protein
MEGGGEGGGREGGRGGGREGGREEYESLLLVLSRLKAIRRGALARGIKAGELRLSNKRLATV